MRWTSWILAAMVVGLAGPAGGNQPGCTDCSRGPRVKPSVMRALDAEACCWTPGCSLAPDCSDNARHCCDNAWAGYCEHRAKVEAFWARVGTSGTCARSKPCRKPAAAPCSADISYPTPTIQPKPAIAPQNLETAPEPPVPTGKAARNASGQRLR